MSQPGETRAGLLNIIAACIVAGGLLGSALIVAHRPAVVAASPGTRPALPAPGATQPPITQASAAAQFRAQVLAAPTLHTFVFKKTTYTLADVHVTQVIYDLKQDVFTLSYTYAWQPAMPSDGPQNNYTQFSNNGYGDYYGTVILNPDDGMHGPHATVTLK